MFSFLPLAVSIVISITGIAAWQSPPVEPEVPTEPAVTTPAANASDAAADALLDALEAKTNELRDFQANVHYRKYESILDETEMYVGRIYYQINPERDPAKRFAIHFTAKGSVEGRTLHDRNHSYIFDGIWLVEKIVDEKQFIKRQIVAPGEEFDPLRLGEGPFPMPIGQTKQDVLRYFDVKSLAKLEEKTFFASQMGDVQGLELMPKPGTSEAEEYEKVEMFYESDTKLPAGIRATKLNGDVESVLFLSPVENTGIEESLLSTDNPPASEGWLVDIQDG